MKLLLVLAAVAFFVWLLRGDRRRAVRQAPPRAAGPQPMVACARCGLHLPASDALPGPDGRQYYCCADHRRGAP